MNKLIPILLLAFVGSLILLPLLFVLGLASGSYLFSLGIGLAGTVIIGTLFVVLVAVIMYYIWKAIPKSMQIVLTILLIALTVVFLQPELALVDVIAIILTIMGSSKGMANR